MPSRADFGSGAPPSPGDVIDGRHQVLSVLAEGGMGVVLKVYDRALDRVCALKWVPRGAGGGTVGRHFQREFRYIAALRHRNIVRVYDFGIMGDEDAYFTMELVEGEPLAKLFDPQRPGPFYRAAAELCNALAFVHERGIIHRDIKSQNVIVVRDPASGELVPKLLDFGLAERARRAWQLPSGTLATMAPEVLRGQGGDGRSDLFGLGAVLYEAVSGSPAFGAGPTASATIRAVLEHDPPPLDTRRPGVHPRFAEIVARLLQKEPSLRYHTAAEVASELEALTAGRQDATEVVSAGVIGGAAIVGRADVLSIMRSLWRNAVHGRGHAAFLVGEEGIGKSRLVEELRVQAQLDGGRVIGLSCGLADGRERGSPFDQLVREVGRLAGGAMEERSESPVGLRLDEPGTAADFKDELQRIVADLAHRLERVARPGGLLLIVEDLHQTAPEVRELVRLLALHLRHGHVTSVITWRDEVFRESQAGKDFLSSIEGLEGEQGVRLLRLARLSADDTAALVARLIGRLGATEHALARRVYEQTDGNPLLIEEALRYLVDQGILRRKGGRFSVTVGSGLFDGPPVTSSLGLRDLLARRLERISPEVRAALQVAAVEGGPFTIGLVARTLGQDRESAAASLREAERRGLIRRSDDTSIGSFVIAQAAIRTAIYRGIGQDERRRLHAAAGQRLERSPAYTDERAVELAHHYIQAGIGRRAIRRALRAAQRCEEHLLPSRAVELYAAALPLLSSRLGEWALRARLQERMGDLLLHLGRFADALAAYRRALVIVQQHPAALRENSSRVTSVRLKRKQGDALARLSRYDEARLLLDEASRALRTFTDEPEQLEVRYVSAWCRMMHAEYADAIEAARDGLALARRISGEPMVARFHLLLANLYWNSGEWSGSVKAAREALRLYRRLGHSRGLADAYLALGSAYRYRAEYGKAITNYRMALEIYEGLGAVAYVGKCHNNLGVVYYLRGSWSEAAQEWEAFVDVCERTGERHERVMLLNNLGVLYSDRSELERAETTLTQGLELARRIGFARIEAMLEANLGEALARKGRHTDAEEHYRRCQSIATTIDARDELVELLRRRCELDLERNDTARLRTRLAEGLQMARELGGRVEEAALLRVRGVLHARTGDLGDAEADLTAAHQIALEVGATLELRKVGVARAQLLAQQGDLDGARTSASAALEGLRELGATFEVRRAEQVLTGIEARASGGAAGADLARLLDINRKFASILDLDDLLRSILDAVIDVTGAERGFVIVHGADGVPVFKVQRNLGGQVAAQDAHISRSVAERVFRTGQSICVSNIDEDERFAARESVLALDLRSILCVPMIVKRRTVGVIYADSQKRAPQELQRSQPLLEALGSQAAVAVENARLYDEERQRSEMIATVAHELKSPLTAVLGYLSIMQLSAADLPADFREYVHIVYDQSERLARMVRNILDLRAIESNSALWSMTSVPISELLQECVSGLRPIADINRIHVELDLLREPADVFGNRDRIQQVVTNLFTNAVKFTPPGGRIRLHAAIVPHEPADRSSVADELGPLVHPTSGEFARVAHFISPSRCVRVAVSDTGSGIAQADVGRIFDKFTQGTLEKSGLRGLGLGLSIAREVVERHGGRIWVETAPGEGSTFLFTLPLMRDRE